jgi:transaldolase
MTSSRTATRITEAAAAPLRVTLYLDGADLQDMERAVAAGVVEGFTTNPTLVAQAGVPNYRTFAAEALARIGGAPISFEVLADDLPAIEA